ncbi:hypothetical protein PsAD13_04418 [Pseudovibrio sp. Ad13]|nr:hypothetical protein PsAD13_04418 [Pseudovibrio sp. Ad13]
MSSETGAGEISAELVGTNFTRVVKNQRCGSGAEFNRGCIKRTGRSSRIAATRTDVQNARTR